MSSIEIEYFFAHPPERVWKALTDTNLLDRWLMKNDFKPVVGRRFTMRRDPQPGFDGVIEGEVVEVDAPERLVYDWHAVGLDMRLTWTLTSVAGGTLLHLHHDGFHGARGFVVRRMAEGGWEQMGSGDFPLILKELAKKRVTGAQRRG